MQKLYKGDWFWYDDGKIGGAVMIPRLETRKSILLLSMYKISFAFFDFGVAFIYVKIPSAAASDRYVFVKKKMMKNVR